MRLEKLRDLQLSAAPEPGRPTHLSAASGLVRVGSTLYVVADDELHLGAFPVSGTAAGTLIRILDGDLPDVLEERKKLKPDFEALTLLPPFTNYPHGALLALGSGSRKRRCRGVLLALDGHGVTSAPVRVLDAARLFETLEKEIQDLNIEGAVVVEDLLLLLHRGNKSHADNAIITFRLQTLLNSIEHDDSLAKGPILAIQHYDLGGIDGIPLCFTDAAALADGRLVFSAVAENTEDNYQDGPCLGAAIGVIAPNGRLQVLHFLDELCKVEGIHAQRDGSSVKLWLVTDADDASVPAALITGELD